MAKPKIKIEQIPGYRFTTALSGTTIRVERLDFIPVSNCPGFSHRVAYNGRLTPKHLGSDFRLSQKVALQMLEIVRTWAEANT
jgi:hypothetical protein